MYKTCGGIVLSVLFSLMCNVTLKIFSINLVTLNINLLLNHQIWDEYNVEYIGRFTGNNCNMNWSQELLNIICISMIPHGLSSIDTFQIY